MRLLPVLALVALGCAREPQRFQCEPSIRCVPFPDGGGFA
jgi:hypothetical protein